MTTLNGGLSLLLCFGFQLRKRQECESPRSKRTRTGRICFVFFLVALFILFYDGHLAEKDLASAL